MKIKIMGGNMKKVLALVVFLFVFVFSLKATAEELPWKPLEEKGNASMQKESPFKLPEPLPEFDGIYIITTDGYIELKPEHKAYDTSYTRWTGYQINHRFKPLDAYYFIPLEKFKGFLFIGKDYRKEKIEFLPGAICVFYRDRKDPNDKKKQNIHCFRDVYGRYIRISDLRTLRTKTINDFTYAIFIESPDKIFCAFDKKADRVKCDTVFLTVEGIGTWVFSLSVGGETIEDLFSKPK
jgi:hypothetical protein